ncbi:MAG TPA: aldo/keto reductase [Polyangiaceae bacterium]
MIGADVTTSGQRLRTGAQIPSVGLGVWQAPRGVAREAVKTALRAGYRHVDTAKLYANETDVGDGLRDSGIPRDEVFVTTKLWNDDQGYDKALRAFDTSLARLGLETVDLYLLHWPVAGKRLDSWRALEKLFDDGRARAIGVSNFLVPHLEELLGKARHPPAVNQIEVHPFLQHRETRAYCKQHDIVVEAYSPLTHGERLTDPVITEVAQRVKRTNAQVLLRWSLQGDMVTLPKSVRAARMAENAAIFDFALDADAMARLDGLEAGSPLEAGWDPRKQA